MYLIILSLIYVYVYVCTYMCLLTKPFPHAHYINLWGFGLAVHQAPLIINLLTHVHSVQ